MTVVPDAYTDKLRNGHPHIVKSYMTIIKPDVVYCGTVAGSPEFGDNVITVSNVSGNISNIVAGMTVYVGTACGDYSKGKRRYRSRNGQDFTLDENTINWTVGDYITVVRMFEFWNVYPYITTTVPFLFYKDRDITYSDQNSYPNPVAIITNGAKLGFLDGPSISFPISGSLSYTTAAGATITSYAWSGTGLSFANASAQSTTMTVSATGYYWLALTVTDSNGKTQTVRVIVRVHDRGTDAPFSDFNTPQPMSQDWNSGGWRTSIECYKDFDIEDYPDDAIVIVWCEQTFAGVEAYYPDNINFYGYLRKGSIRKIQNTGTVTFDIETIDALMSNAHMYSVSLEYSTSPDKWYKYYKLTAARTLHHYFKWHSTLFEIANVFLPMTETTEFSASDDFDAGSMMSQAETFAYERSIFAHIMCDKHGEVQIRQDIHLLPNATRAANQTLFNITAEDHLPEVEVVLNTEATFGHIIVSGGRRNPDDNTLFPIISQAPGELPLNRGSEKNVIENLVIASQSDGNVLAGRVLANLNRYVDEVRLKLAGNYHSILECLPQYWLHLYDAPNMRNIPLEGNYTLKSITSQLDTKTGTNMTDIVLIPDVESNDGIPGPYPEDPEENGGGGGGGGGIHTPPWIPPPPPPPIVDPTSDVYAAIAADIRGTGNFGDVSPTWVTKLGAITGTIIDATKAAWDPTFNVIYVLTATSVWKTEDFQIAAPTWTEVYNVTTDSNFTDKSPVLTRIVTPPTISGRVYVLATALTTVGGSEGTAWLVRSDDGGGTWTDYEIEGGLSATPYTVTHGTALVHYEPGSPIYTEITHTRVGDDENTINPWAIAFKHLSGNPGWATTGFAQNATSIHDYDTSLILSNTLWADNNELLSAGDQIVADGWLDAYFGVGVWTRLAGSPHNMTLGATRVKTRHATSWGSALDIAMESWVFWNKPNIVTPIAMDCGKHDGNKVYIGTDTKILRTIDGGETWEDYNTETGANDIECHYTQTSDDDITIWATSGQLYRVIAGVLGDDLYTEASPTAVPYRICSDPMTPDVIYALPNGTLLIKWTDGSIPALKIGLTSARSLSIKPGATLALRRIFFLEGDKITYSLDDGANWLDKTGDYTGYGTPIRIESFE